MNVDELILEIVAGEVVSDQSQLRRLLAARGHALTQPTLSRHLKKLSVAKQNGRYQRVERNPADRPPHTMLESPPNLLILKTAPGHAQLLGVLVDRSGVGEIAGTLAGDDTVYIALSAGTEIEEVKTRLDEILKR